MRKQSKISKIKKNLTRLNRAETRNLYVALAFTLYGAFMAAILLYGAVMMGLDKDGHIILYTLLLGSLYATGAALKAIENILK